jgi:hypothetical protein
MGSGVVRGVCPEESHMHEAHRGEQVSVTHISPPLQWMFVWATESVAGALSQMRSKSKHDSGDLCRVAWSSCT